MYLLLLRGNHTPFQDGYISYYYIRSYFFIFLVFWLLAQIQFLRRSPSWNHGIPELEDKVLKKDNVLCTCLLPFSIIVITPSLSNEWYHANSSALYCHYETVPIDIDITLHLLVIYALSDLLSIVL
jgi:hypothetical protein